MGFSPIPVKPPSNRFGPPRWGGVWSKCVLYVDHTTHQEVPMDLVRQKLYTAPSNPNGGRTVGPIGLGVNYDSTSWFRFDCPPPIFGEQVDDTPISLLAIVTLPPDDSGTGRYVWAGDGDDSDTYVCLERQGSTLYAESRFTGGSIGGSEWPAATYTIPSELFGKTVVIVGTMSDRDGSNAITVNLYVNGSNVGSDTNGGTGASNTFDRISVGILEDSSSSPTTGADIGHVAAVFGGELTEAEALEISLDPWGPFRRERLSSRATTPSSVTATYCAEYPATYTDDCDSDGGGVPSESTDSNRIGGTGAIRRSPLAHRRARTGR